MGAKHRLPTPCPSTVGVCYQPPHGFVAMITCHNAQYDTPVAGVAVALPHGLARSYGYILIRVTKAQYHPFPGTLKPKHLANIS